MKEGHLEGLKTIASSFGPKETMERLESEISAKGMKVFARVDHAAGAADAGLFLRPTDLIIFGNARAGTPLLQASQTVGIDLPLKALVWQDEGGKTWLSYYEPNWIIRRHGLAIEAEVIAKMTVALSAVSIKATNPQ
jgi:uncharacterized protein (DUF302 family)